jgi:hypothetical protein
MGAELDWNPEPSVFYAHVLLGVLLFGFKSCGEVLGLLACDFEFRVCVYSGIGDDSSPYVPGVLHGVSFGVLCV